MSLLRCTLAARQLFSHIKGTGRGARARSKKNDDHDDVEGGGADESNAARTGLWADSQRMVRARARAAPAYRSYTYTAFVSISRTSMDTSAALRRRRRRSGALTFDALPLAVPTLHHTSTHLKSSLSVFRASAAAPANNPRPLWSDAAPRISFAAAAATAAPHCRHPLGA
jgi:hypothetical protein